MLTTLAGRPVTLDRGPNLTGERRRWGEGQVVAEHTIDQGAIKKAAKKKATAKEEKKKAEAKTESPGKASKKAQPKPRPRNQSGAKDGGGNQQHRKRRTKPVGEQHSLSPVFNPKRGRFINGFQISGRRFEIAQRAIDDGPHPGALVLVIDGKPISGHSDIASLFRSIEAHAAQPAMNGQKRPQTVFGDRRAAKANSTQWPKSGRASTTPQGA